MHVFTFSQWAKIKSLMGRFWTLGLMLDTPGIEVLWESTWIFKQLL